MVLKSSSLLGIKLTGHQACPSMSALPAPSLASPWPAFGHILCGAPCWIQGVRSLRAGWVGLINEE